MSRPPDLSDAVIELLLRYEHGHFAPNVRKRLAELFRTNPPDVLQRLERAAEHLGVDGSDVAEWAEKPTPLGSQRSRTPTHQNTIGPVT